jgi:hypothetical protein
MGLFALIFAIEIVPMVTFIRVRTARKKKRAAAELLGRCVSTHQ